jgi:colicin import membrane protein
MWRFIRENPGAAIFAVLVHVVFAAALVLTLDGKTHTPAINPQAKIIKAKVIDEAKRKKEHKRKEAKKKKKEERKKREEKKKEEKRKAELKKKKLAVKKKKEAEAKKKKLAAEKKRKQELKKKQEEQERKQRIAEMQKQMDLELAREEAERKKQAQRAAQQKEVDRYRVLIKQAISNKWRVPFSARKGQECILKLRLIPSGEVVSVEVVKSSGDREYDLSVEKAVYAAMPLPLPPADSGLFHEFREINVPFRLESRNL